LAPPAESCSRCRRPADSTRGEWRAVGDELVCPGCLSALETETAPLAPRSPIDHYLKELDRRLELPVRRRRRVVAEVEAHLRESATEERELHSLSPWQSERAAIARMGDVGTIVAGYELTEPKRRGHRRWVVLAAVVVVALMAAVLARDLTSSHGRLALSQRLTPDVGFGRLVEQPQPNGSTCAVVPVVGSPKVVGWLVYSARKSAPIRKFEINYNPRERVRWCHSLPGTFHLYVYTAIAKHRPNLSYDREYTVTIY
jgi:hypothetical protein